MSVRVSNIAGCSSKTDELRDIDSIGCRTRISPSKTGKLTISKSKSSRLSKILVDKAGHLCRLRFSLFARLKRTYAVFPIFSSLSSDLSDTPGRTIDIRFTLSNYRNEHLHYRLRICPANLRFICVSNALYVR